MSGKLEDFWKARKLYDKFMQQDIQAWMSHEVLTWNWWLLVAFSIFPWVIFWKVLDKKRILEIALFGSLSIIITTFLDVIGSDLSFWGYPIDLLPIGPEAIPFDMSIVPVGYMLLYQYFRTWKQFNIALICWAFLYSFIGEPLSVWLGWVFYIKWKYIYSFVYYIIIGLIIRVVIEKFKLWIYEDW